MDPESKANETGAMAEIDHLQMQKQSMSTTEPGTTFNPSVCKRLKLKADCILIPPLSLAYLLK